jgi:AcrR family transcriptional regulator
VSSDLGLRERKKEQTRRQIAATAARLFAERGFDAVTVADVAREADVSTGTVFNYFPTKEDLFYSEMELFEERVLDAVRGRPAGESVLAGFQRVVLDGIPRLATDDTGDVISTAAEIVASSRSLQAREREILARRTEQLAALIAEETGRLADDVEPAAVAAALMGVQRALVAYVHTSVLAGRRGAKLATDTRAQARRAFRRLEHGLADYDIATTSTETGPGSAAHRGARSVPSATPSGPES